MSLLDIAEIGLYITSVLTLGAVAATVSTVRKGRKK